MAETLDDLEESHFFQRTSRGMPDRLKRAYLSWMRDEDKPLDGKILSVERFEDFNAREVS